MKKIIYRFICTILISTLIIPEAYASFSDVTSSNPNSTAINYLQENNVLQGYPDGTFRPNNEVNRAEFLKIIIEGSNIETDVSTPTSFPDVDNNAWYAPYVRKAYNEGWIQGYPDGTFKPAQTINKVESLKILSEAQNWQLPSVQDIENPYADVLRTMWYATYVAYAKDHGYLEETGTSFSPGNNMTRAKISEVIYRTLTDRSENIENTETEETNETDITEDLNVNTGSTVSSNFFENITLDSNIPATFYKDEIYYIEGSIDSGSYDTATVMIQKSSGDYQTFTGELTNDHFSIPVSFTDSRSSYIGILPGESGNTHLAAITILSSLPSNSSTISAPSKITSLDLNYADSETYAEFNAASNTLKEFTFTQGSKSKKYFSRQNTNKLAITYSDFANFSEGKTTLTIRQAKITSINPLVISSNFSDSFSTDFTASTHTYSENETTLITVNPPDTLSSGQTINLSGKTKTYTSLTAYVQKPDGFVEVVELKSSTPTVTHNGMTALPASANFTYSYKPKSSGLHIVEINNTEGIAVLNHPIYVGSSIPLIPDYFDLNSRTSLYSGTNNIQTLRSQLLNLINDSRREHGLSEVSLSEEINEVAQMHSDDMADNNYFSHFNLQGEDPEDRRLRLGISVPISENIAKDVSIRFAHEGLMRSAGHRENILEADWDVVGLGIAVDSGYLYITEEFATSLFTSAELQSKENDLIDEINDLRGDNSLSALTETVNLSEATDYLNDRLIDGSLDLDNSSLLQAMELYDIVGGVNAIGRAYSTWNEIISSILAEDTILEETWDYIGVDLKQDTNGSLHTLLLLNNN